MSLIRCFSSSLNGSEAPRLKLGDYVRLKILPADCQPTPLRVRQVLTDGTIRLDGWQGYFMPYLFVVVDPPQEKSA
jgi:hypothetical protein